MHTHIPLTLLVLKPLGLTAYHRPARLSVLLFITVHQHSSLLTGAPAAAAATLMGYVKGSTPIPLPLHSLIPSRCFPYPVNVIYVETAEAAVERGGELKAEGRPSKSRGF